MNRFPLAFNFVQGLISLMMTYVYFTSGERLIMMVLISTLFLISLLSISLGIRRRSKVVEVAEVLIYYLFFGLLFMGGENFEDVAFNPMPSYFWIVWAVGLTFNWGEWLGKVVLKVTSRPDSDIEE